jgi:hypothetical protein
VQAFTSQGSFLGPASISALHAGQALASSVAAAPDIIAATTKSEQNTMCMSVAAFVVLSLLCQAVNRKCFLDL